MLVDLGAVNEAGTNNVDASARQFNDVVANRNPVGTSGATTTAGTAIPLVNSADASTGISLTITNPAGQAYASGFDDVNFGGGATAPTGQALALGYTGAETQNSSFGNTGSFNSTVDPVTRLVLSGLRPTMTYGFDLFASRTATDNRDTHYTITGGTGGTAATGLVEPVANNTGTVVSASGFTANAGGDITINVQAAATNTNASGLYSLGILQINTTAVPEPASLGVIGVAGAALASRRRRRL